jgi:hypothetical protein
MKTIAIGGNSHAELIMRSFNTWDGQNTLRIEAKMFNDKKYEGWLRLQENQVNISPILLYELSEFVEQHPSGHIAMMIGGSTHFAISAVNNPRPFDFIVPGYEDLTLNSKLEVIPYDLIESIFITEEKQLLEPLVFCRKLTTLTTCLTAPPPVRHEQRIVEHMPEWWKKDAEQRGVPNEAFRLKIWLAYTNAVKIICDKHDIELIYPPKQTCDDDGFLKEEFSGDALHGNEKYGWSVLELLRDKSVSIGL